MNSEIEYNRVLRTSIITEDELNAEFGLFNWSLVSARELSIGNIEYIFSRKKAVLFHVWICDLGEGNLFTDKKTIDFNWYNDFMPRVGERFEPMVFLETEEKDFINKYTKIEDWLTPQGIDIFESSKKWNEKMSLIEETLSDFLYRNINHCFIKELQMSYNTHQRRMIVNIWLSQNGTE